MAITAQRTFETVGPVVRLPGTMTANVTYYKGQLLVWNAGLLTNPTNAANLVPAGVMTGQAFDPQNDGKLVLGAGDTAITGEVVRGKIWIPLSTAAVTSVGVIHYMTDNGDVTVTAGAKTWGVMCVGWKTGFVLLDFDNLQGAAA